MKIALCLSGQPRFVSENFENVFKTVIKNNNIDVFVHTWYSKDMEGQNFQTSHMAKERMSGSFKISKKEIDFLQSLYKPKKILIEKPKKFSFRKDFDIKPPPLPYGEDRQSGLISMWYSIYKANELKKQYEKENNFKYDWVLRFRTDAFFEKKINFEEFDKEKINTRIFRVCSRRKDCLHDQYAISNSFLMDVYSDLYNNFKKLASNSRGRRFDYGSHNFLYYYLINEKKIIVNFVANDQFLFKV